MSPNGASTANTRVDGLDRHLLHETLRRIPNDVATAAQAHGRSMSMSSTR
jgi:hypothetical protein